MNTNKYDHFTKLPPDNKRCTAMSKRSRQRCKNWAMRYGKTVCRFHGGRSLLGHCSPRYKHGYYSKDIFARLPWDLIERQLRIERYVEKHMAELRKKKEEDLQARSQKDDDFPDTFYFDFD